MGRFAADDNRPLGSYILEAAEPGIAYQVVFIPTAGSDMVTTWYSGPGGPGRRAEPAPRSCG